MQLKSLVSFHKAMGDPTRIRILVLLAKGPLHGQAIAGKLGLTPPTITHHISKLKDVGLIIQRRDKNTLYFKLNEKVLNQQTEAIKSVIYGKGINMEDSVDKVNENQAILNNFLTADGRIKTIPSQRKKKLIVLEHLVKGLEKGRKYTEKEINEYIKRFHEDFATIRREFIMNHFMYREDAIYEVNPVEMWAKIE
ncbi:metalloregulator ArsR/SmtB family transcription factor [Bacillus timonensis]|nr:metalloregulator ArsR/SmtB family transcription factor [Bacillus timonensis]